MTTLEAVKRALDLLELIQRDGVLPGYLAELDECLSRIYSDIDDETVSK